MTESNACPAPGARIFVSSGGVVTLNGAEVAPAGLLDALRGLNPAPTVLCYSRENPPGEPHPVSTQVVEAMIAMRLPVAFFTDASFKTPVEPG